MATTNNTVAFYVTNTGTNDFYISDPETNSIEFSCENFENVTSVLGKAIQKSEMILSAYDSITIKVEIPLPY